MTTATLSAIFATALLARGGGCEKAEPPAQGSAVATPTLAPSGSGSATPTTTTMTPEAQAKLDKMVGAKPGSHKPIKPTPEPVAAGSGSGSGEKPAKPHNRFPEDGPELSEHAMFDIPEMDRHQEEYSYGALVRLGYSSVPHYMAYRCKTKPTCAGWSHMGSDWAHAGWWGWQM